MKKALVWMLGLIGIAVAAPVMAADGGAFTAQWTPFQWGVFPPVQLFSTPTPVRGFRLSTVYSDNQEMGGLDVGLFTGAKTAIGMQVAGANFVTDRFVGLQIAVANANGNEGIGVQIGGANINGPEDLSTTGKFKGVQAGWVNVSNSVFGGCQVALANLSNWTYSGLQLGLINCNDDAGAPEKKRCVQIGLINYNTSGFILFSPLVNF